MTTDSMWRLHVKCTYCGKVEMINFPGFVIPEAAANALRNLGWYFWIGENCYRAECPECRTTIDGNPQNTGSRW